MPAQINGKAEIEQLRREIAAHAQEAQNRAPNPVRAAMVPFALGAVSVLATFIFIALLAKLI